MPLGYEMLTIQHTVGGEVREIYAAEGPDFLEHPWFSQFYILSIPGGYGSGVYGFGAYGSGPYGSE